MTALTVAAAQIECRPGEVGANLALHLDAIATARERGADLLLFPELSLTDYLPRPDLPRLARPADAPELIALATAAGDMLVSVGFIEEHEGRFHNAQALLGGGRVLSVHRKLNLPTYGRLTEGLHYAKGERIETVAHGAWSLATLICAETWNPALPWLAALRGASLLLVPIASSLHVVDHLDNRSGWELNLRHTALTYGLPLVMANHCGARNGLAFWGGSRILDAFGRELARAGDWPEVIVAELSLNDVRRARARLPTIRDAGLPAILDDPHDQEALSTFLAACGDEKPEMYIYAACRVAVAHVSPNRPSDPDEFAELRRLHSAADVMRRLARRFISVDLGVSDSSLEPEVKG